MAGTTIPPAVSRYVAIVTRPAGDRCPQRRVRAFVVALTGWPMAYRLLDAAQAR
jgi:hypothetical protein